jgi:hypothetical protein
MSKEDDEEDYGALIYRESQLRKAEAAAAKAAKEAKKKKKKDGSPADVSSTRRRATSTRASSAGNAKSRSYVNATQRKKSSKRKREAEGEEQAPRKVAQKQYRYECSADGCTNNAVKGGVCVTHGVKVNTNDVCRKCCRQRRCMQAAWSKSQTMQQRRMHNFCSEGKSVR